MVSNVSRIIEESRILAETKKALAKEKKLEAKEKSAAAWKRLKKWAKPSSTPQKKSLLSRFKGGKKATAKRAVGVKRLLGGLGMLPRNVSRGRGRPSGTYKYGMPIQEYKSRISERKAMIRLQQQLAMERVMKSGRQPQQLQQPQQVQQQMAQQQTFQQPEQEFQQPQQTFQDQMSMTPDERKLRQLQELATVTPNTMMILDDIRRIQGKAQADDANMQRIKREQRMVGDATNLLKARNLFGADSNKMDLLSTEGTILMAPNVFKEMSGNRIMRTNRHSILNTKDAGNDLRFGK